MNILLGVGAWFLFVIGYGGWHLASLRGWERGFQDGWRLRGDQDLLLAHDAEATGIARGRCEMLREILDDVQSGRYVEIAYAPVSEKEIIH